MATLTGVVLIVLGIFALAAPLLIGIISVVSIGALIAVTGLAELIQAFKSESIGSRIIWLLVGLASLICGALVIAHPIYGLGFLALLLTVYFLAEGIFKLAAAVNYARSRAWFILSGILSLALAWIIWANQPLSGGWVIGITVGIDLIFTGVLVLAIKEEI